MIIAIGICLIVLPFIALLTWMAIDTSCKVVAQALAMVALICTPIMLGVYLLDYAGALQ